MWKEPTQLLLTQPTSRPREQPTWDSLCVATDFGTGQLQGEVGIPENPRFTYEEAVHNRRSGKGVTLYTEEDIVQLESDELIQRSGPKLKKLRLAVKESELPLLSQGVLPGGWDALRRPWALMDCPVAQVPQIPSAHSHSRVTVTVLVSFPPEPLYFPNLAHMDRAVRVWKKASQKRPLGMSEELHADGRMKGARRTYERLLLPGYHYRVPVQETLKEARWPDFWDGHWGNRENPPAPTGDVRPAPTMETPPAEKQTAAAASGSALSQRSVTSSVISAGVSSRGTLASGTLRIVIPTIEAESSEDEMSVPASPPRLRIPQGLATGSMAHAVTSSVIYHQQLEDEAAASSSRSQEDGLSGQQSTGSGRDLMPMRADYQESREGSENDSEGARPRVGQDTVTTVETCTWDEMDGAVWQSVRGTLEGAMGYALAVLDQIRTDVEERF